MVVKDRSKLSQKPENIRKRLRRGAQAADEESLLLANAKKPIEEWDIVELARGRPRDKNGTFRGAPPTWITPAVKAEAKKRLMSHALDEMSGHVVEAITVVSDIMNDENEETRVRLQAATFVIEHVMGKPKTKVEVDTSDTVRTFLAGALVLPDGAPAHPVIDGTIVEGVDDGH